MRCPKYANYVTPMCLKSATSRQSSRRTHAPALSAPRLASTERETQCTTTAPRVPCEQCLDKLHVRQETDRHETAAPAAVVVDVAKSSFPFGRLRRPGYVGLVEDVVHGALVVSKGLRPFHEVLGQ